MKRNSQTPTINKVEPQSAAIIEPAANSTNSVATPTVPQKTKLEKSQTLLSVVSTSIGLVGVAGSVFAFATATFYTGAVEVKTDQDLPGVVVKVYTKEGHESIFHSKHVDLMPGKYHLEISAPDNKPLHTDVNVRFREKTSIPAPFVPSNNIAQQSLDSDTVTSEVNELNKADAAAEQRIENFSINSVKDAKNATDSPAKKRWWQFWKRGSKDENGTDSKE